MELFTKVNFRTQVHSIHHTSKLLAIGSCFSENIGEKLKNNHFNIVTNPFGINYHPLSIHSGLSRLINNQSFKAEELIQNNGLWHSWHHHSSFSNPDKHKALDKMNRAFIKAQAQLENLDYLLLTFGTAYGYVSKKEGQLVANCHKFSPDHFFKFLSIPDTLVTALIELIVVLKHRNKKLKVILSVSPVRHKKEGLVENNRSKARCIYLAEKLTESFDYCQYFPAYEMLIDELRDYRFFNSDLVHPSDQAIEYIWEKFSEKYFKKETLLINKKLTAFHRAVDHRPFFPDSAEHQLFLKKEREKLRKFKTEHPAIKIEGLEAQFTTQIK